jgi:hypothetical protein
MRGASANDSSLALACGGLACARPCEALGLASRVRSSLTLACGALGFRLARCEAHYRSRAGLASLAPRPSSKVVVPSSEPPLSRFRFGPHGETVWNDRLAIVTSSCGSARDKVVWCHTIAG